MCVAYLESIVKNIFALEVANKNEINKYKAIHSFESKDEKSGMLEANDWVTSYENKTIGLIQHKNSQFQFTNVSTMLNSFLMNGNIEVLIYIIKNKPAFFDGLNIFMLQEKVLLML